MTAIGLASERAGELRGPGVLPSSALLAWLREHPGSGLAAWIRHKAYGAPLVVEGSLMGVDGLRVPKRRWWPSRAGRLTTPAPGLVQLAIASSVPHPAEAARARQHQPAPPRRDRVREREWALALAGVVTIGVAVWLWMIALEVLGG